MVSRSEDSLKSFAGKYKSIQEMLHTDIEKVFTILQLKADIAEHIKLNFEEEVRYSLVDEDVDAVSELLRLPYYHGIVKEMLDLKFI